MQKLVSQENSSLNFGVYCHQKNIYNSISVQEIYPIVIGIFFFLILLWKKDNSEHAGFYGVITWEINLIFIATRSLKSASTGWAYRLSNTRENMKGLQFLLYICYCTYGTKRLQITWINESSPCFWPAIRKKKMCFCLREASVGYTRIHYFVCKVGTLCYIHDFLSILFFLF